MTPPRYDRNNLPTGQWDEYHKKATTWMRPVTGPLVIQTKDNECDMPEGWKGFIALDAEGYPYPLEADVQQRSYESLDSFRHLTD